MAKHKETMNIPNIPYDVYESNKEIVIIIPLGGVKKESIDISVKDYKLLITGKRGKPIIEDKFAPLKEDCYRGDVQVVIDLPPKVHFDKIKSKLTSPNILEIIVPKSNMPEKIPLEIEED